MTQFITKCPACQSDDIRAVRLECQSCQTRFEGAFKLPVLLKLEEADQKFVLDFVLTSGSLKDMAKKIGISYPTLRIRLDQLIQKIQALQSQPTTPDLEKETILALLEQGKITVKEASELLAKL